MDKMRNRLSQLRYRLAEKLRAFMIGRYGRPDELYRFLNISIFVLIILSIFIRSWVLNLVILLLLFYSTYRLCSRNIQARYEENQKFIALRKKIRNFFNVSLRRVKEHKDYRFRKCPDCKKMLRLPNKKGSHTVVCPICGCKFEVKI